MRRLVTPQRPRKFPLPALGGLADGPSRLSDDDREALAAELELLTGAAPTVEVSRAADGALLDDEPGWRGSRVEEDEEDLDWIFGCDGASLGGPDEAAMTPPLRSPGSTLPRTAAALPRRGPASAPAPAPLPEEPPPFFLRPGEEPPPDLWDHALPADEGRAFALAPAQPSPPDPLDPEHLGQLYALADAAEAEAQAELAWLGAANRDAERGRAADGSAYKAARARADEAWGAFLAAEALHHAAMADLETEHAKLLAEEEEAPDDWQDALADLDERELIADDLCSDADDWARSEEDGWFYGDD